MSHVFTLDVLTDVHYASAAEQARGDNFESRSIRNPAIRALVKVYRHFIWLRHPLRQNHLFDRFLEHAGPVDGMVANGDYSCDSGFVGVSDDAACQSVRECLGRLREKYGDKLRANFGDHELGKLSLLGAAGGMRLASYHRARSELGLVPFWQLDLGCYRLMGVTSSLVALPVFEPDTLPEERPQWTQLRQQHLAEIRAAFSALKSEHRVLLFCHDPTALPFLWREEAVRARLPQIEQTVIGHLHSNLVLWKARLLAGMPPISCFGQSVKRMTTALREAGRWKPFNVRLCPSLAGIELLKDGGFLTVELDADAKQPARFYPHRIHR